jgi:hypothetical protein
LLKLFFENKNGIKINLQLVDKEKKNLLDYAFNLFDKNLFEYLESKFKENNIKMNKYSKQKKQINEEDTYGKN